MKAIIVPENGGADVLKYVEDAPMPTIGPKDILVNIKATSVNRIDIVVRNGYPGIPIPLPHIPGGDICGVVAEIGAEVRSFKVGDRVLAWPLVVPESELDNPDAFLSDGWQYFGLHRSGSYAEYVAVPEASLVHLPDNISFEEGAALPISGLTAFHAIHDVAQLKPGQKFVIWGGSGGFGTLALQLAKSAGAVVIATAGRDDKESTLRDLGADYVFNHYNQDVGAEVRKLFPGGVDCVLDYVGPKTFDTSFGMLRKGGKILLCGMLTGREVTLNIQHTYLRHISIHGLYLGRRSELEQLVERIAREQMRTHIHTVMPLKDAAEAHRLVESGNYVGKIVLTP